MSKLLLHIGLPKTGTTSLQEHYFARHPGIVNIGKPRPLDQFEQALLQLIRSDRLEYTRDRVAPILKDHVAEAAKAGLPMVLSNEGLSYSWRADRLAIAERLKDVFPEAKILITVREQRSLVESLFFDEVRWRIANNDTPEFGNWLWQHFANRGMATMLDYDGLARAYEDLFGRSSVIVLPFEIMSHDPSAFLKRVAEELGISPREDLLRQAPRARARISHRRYKLSLVARTLVGRLPYRVLVKSFSLPPLRFVTNKILDGLGAHVAWPTDLLASFNGLYAESNDRLGQRYGLDLSSYGYSLQRSADPDNNSWIPAETFMPPRTIGQ